MPTPTHAALLLIVALASGSAAADSVVDLLEAGRLVDAEQTVRKTLSTDPENSLAKTQLGVVQLLRGVERLGQTNHRFGVGAGRRWAPFFRLGVEPNDNPQVVTYEDVRTTLQQLLDDLSIVEATLASIGDHPVKWNVDIARLRVDLNADGQATEAESLGRIYLDLATRRRRDADLEATFPVGLDTGDVYWLRGYCHLLSAVAETLLAYDQQEMFDHTAQLLFPNAAIRHDLFKQRPEERRDAWLADALDGIAMLHLIDWPLREPDRLKASHDHLLKMIDTSRASWLAIQAEEDDDNEWIPNPSQRSVLPGGVLTQAQIDAWHDFLAEAEDLLRGEKLAPFWRDPSRGINLHRVFHEPQRFDLVLWVQGTSATTYLEKGKQTKTETWQTFQRVFRGNFIGFAFWIN